MLHHNERWIIY